MAIELHILYFASLAETADTDTETINVDDGTPLGVVYQILKDKHGFKMTDDKLAVAINHHMANWQSPIKDGDIIAFIPPVAGG
ncbi:MAG: molybdopterin converting factor subunit 1 [Moraxella sp.]|nr:molybdopterin converting factor subunit 1 [Moraxella sp.]